MERFQLVCFCDRNLDKLLRTFTFCLTILRLKERPVGYKTPKVSYQVWINAVVGGNKEILSSIEVFSQLIP